MDRLQHLTTLANAHAAFVRYVPVPDGVLGVETDAVGEVAAEVSPYPPVRQSTVDRDIEGREPLAVGVGNDQRSVVGRHGHAIREGNAVGHLSSRAIGGDESNRSGCERLTSHKIKAAAVDVDVAATVHDDLVPVVVREAGEVDMGRQRPVGLPAEEQPIAAGHDEQTV